MVDTVRIHVYSISGRLFLAFLVNISALESVVTGNADETEMVTESNSNIRHFEIETKCQIHPKCFTNTMNSILNCTSLDNHR